MDPDAVRIRPARREDLASLRALTPRRTSCGPLTTRDGGAAGATVMAQLEDALERSAAGGDRQGAPGEGVGTGACVFVAESLESEPVGCVEVQVALEFFSGEPESYVAALVVSGSEEGKGVGRALMAAAEAWARQRGLTRLSLEVFAGNARARDFYRKLGFEEDSLRLVREW